MLVLGGYNADAAQSTSSKVSSSEKVTPQQKNHTKHAQRESSKTKSKHKDHLQQEQRKSSMMHEKHSGKQQTQQY